AGRAFASELVTVWQRDRMCVRSFVLLDVDEPDVIRHQPAMPDVGGPDSSPELAIVDKVFPGSELRVVGGIDTADPDAPVGPAELHLWTRLPGGPEDVVVSQAVLSYATVGFLIRTALRPHPGFGGDLVHARLSTTVLAHTVDFHEPFRANDWLLLCHRSRYAG